MFHHYPFFVTEISPEVVPKANLECQCGPAMKQLPVGVLLSLFIHSNSRQAFPEALVLVATPTASS